jgi:hypothetical protein
MKTLYSILPLLLPFLLYAQQPSEYKAFLPDPALTPGIVLTLCDSCICVKGYSSKVRNVPAAIKKVVYSEYHIKHHATGEYEVDHLISLELGGSNDIKNLWPESYLSDPWNAHVKDKLENRLHRLVCTGHITLKEAQEAIRTDWIAAYKKYVVEPGKAARK